MIKLNNRFVWWVSCFIVFLSFYLIARAVIDSDFGWHLRFGQIVLQHGIPTEDPFSYTMPHYQFINHEWLTDVFFARIYPLVGYEGLAIIFAVIAFLALIIRTFRTRWSMLPFFISVLGILPLAVGVRVQAISWLFFSILLTVFFRKNLWKQFKFALPVLFLLWVNLHGAFALGIASVFIFVITNGIQRKITHMSDVIVALLCLMVTFINPYGWKIWWEVWLTTIHASWHWTITEWYPALFSFNTGFLILFPLSVLLTLRYRNKNNLLELVFYFCLLILAIVSIRHVPFWLLMTVSFTAKQIGFLYQEIHAIPHGQKRFNTAYNTLTGTVFAVTLLSLLFTLPYYNISPYWPYPVKAVEYIRNHPSNGNLFAEYGMGGYLIWQYPQKKVFIDGRMPSWRQDNPPAGESTDALAEYNQVMIGEGAVSLVFQKYHIDTVLLNKNEESVVAKEFIERLFGIRLSNKQRLQKQLKLMGMRVIYQDERFIVYRKIFRKRMAYGS